MASPAHAPGYNSLLNGHLTHRVEGVTEIRLLVVKGDFREARRAMACGLKSPVTTRWKTSDHLLLDPIGLSSQSSAFSLVAVALLAGEPKRQPYRTEACCAIGSSARIDARD